MPFTDQTDADWPSDNSQRKGYKVFKNVEAVIECWKIRDDASSLCLVNLLSNNKPAHISRAIISKSGTCPAYFTPESFCEGDEIMVDLCEPSSFYQGTAMANYCPNPAKTFEQKASAAPVTKEILSNDEPTTKVVITNVPKALKDSWDVYCKQQGLQPWRAFKDLVDEKLLPF